MDRGSWIFLSGIPGRHKCRFWIYNFEFVIYLELEILDLVLKRIQTQFS
jgi:hypothetical protein